MKVRIGIIVFGLLTSTSAYAASRCDVPLIRTYDNQTSSGIMQVTNGRPCSIVINATAGAIFATELAEKARNGSVVVSGHRITYTSRPGYVGDDKFTYLRRGVNAVNQPIVRTINVAVQVMAATP